MSEIYLRNMTSIYLMCGKKMLLLYRIGSRVVKDSYTGTAGGHFEAFELNNPKACVLRELFEETGLTEENIYDMSLRYITLRRKGNEIRQNYYYFANINNGIEISSNEGNLEWLDFDKLLDLEMPHSSKAVIKHYFEIGKDTNYLYCGIADKNDVYFKALEDFI